VNSHPEFHNQPQITDTLKYTTCRVISSSQKNLACNKKGCALAQPGFQLFEFSVSDQCIVHPDYRKRQPRQVIHAAGHIYPASHVIVSLVISR
jgi:hypothetical protein